MRSRGLSPSPQASRDSDEIALYDRIFETLWDVAIRGDDLAVFLCELIEGLRRWRPRRAGSSPAGQRRTFVVRLDLGRPMTSRVPMGEP